MKKISLSLIAIVFAINFSYAQWTGGPTGSIYYNGGSVGIGTTSPGNTLDVNGGINTSGLSNLNGVTFNTFATFSKQLQAPGYNLNILSGDGNSLLLLPYTSNTAYAHFQNFGLVIDGNVGIGTTSPAQKLSVDGNFLLQNSTANSKGYLFSAPTSNWGPSLSGLYFTPRDGVDGTPDFSINLWDGTAGTPGWGGTPTRFFINAATGSIGIGTTSPDQKLTVKGTIHSQEVIVDMSVLPDYVFKPANRLPSLTEVKTYIDQNHHLPEMPSAEEVAKDGLSLGDMNAKLLKKVEELTLYLIEKDKQIDNQRIINNNQNTINQSQRKEIDELKKQVSTLIKSKP